MSIMLPEIDFERIGQRVKQARIDKGYTQAELGEVIGCSNNHMSHIETGNTKLSLPVLVSIAEVLEVHTDDLLFEKAITSRASNMNDIMAMLGDCSSRELSVIRDVVKASKTAFRKYFSI